MADREPWATNPKIRHLFKMHFGGGAIYEKTCEFVFCYDSNSHCNFPIGAVAFASLKDDILKLPAPEVQPPASEVEPPQQAVPEQPKVAKLVLPVGLADADLARSDRAQCRACVQKVEKAAMWFSYREVAGLALKNVRRYHIGCADAMPAATRSADIAQVKQWMMERPGLPWEGLPCHFRSGSASSSPGQ